MQRISLLLIFVFSSAILSAAPAPPTGGGAPGCWPPPCIPIDGGVSILVALGALYGAKRISQQKGGISE